MTNPTGVPHAINTQNYPTRPRWTLAYRVGGEAFERSYDVAREIEARSRLAAEVPEAYDVEATYSEVPF